MSGAPWGWGGGAGQCISVTQGDMMCVLPRGTIFAKPSPFHIFEHSTTLSVPQITAAVNGQVMFGDEIH